MRLLFYTGKGGVGKTTTAVATAACAAARGRRALVLSADPAHSLGDVLDTRLGPEPREVAPRLHALEVDARVELEQHWGRIREYLISLFRHQGIEDVVADELALLPGAEELAALLAVDRHAEAFDLIVVDCAPTGSTLRLVTLPEVATQGLRLLLRVQRALAAVVTPLAQAVVPVPLPGAGVFRDVDRLVYRRLAAIRERLLDPGTHVRLVVTPERMVIDEGMRSHTDLALFDLGCDAVVMNRLLPDAALAEDFFRDWGRLQEERCAEVAEGFAPLPLLRAALREDEVVGPEALARHGAALFADAQPDAVLCSAPRVRFRAADGGYRVELPLPHATRAGLDVAKRDDQLLVRAGGRRRAVPLPRRLARLHLAGARLENGCLTVRLAAPEPWPEPH
ncbi:MAG: TRC40/GET3/ArsA family transport-energizing ATPase [Myxococcota bacterium]|nr:TRC40/GET3/ArsA family transport-energizing ATPase [Myxococcota bacterium]